MGGTSLVKFGTAVAVASALAAFHAGVGMAQPTASGSGPSARMDTSRPVPVWIGVYEPLTSVQQARLGTTLLFEPEALQQTAFLYRYDVASLMKAGVTKEGLLAAVSAGEAIVLAPEYAPSTGDVGKRIVQVSVSTDPSAYFTAKRVLTEHGVQGLSEKELIVVSASRKLLGSGYSEVYASRKSPGLSATGKMYTPPAVPIPPQTDKQQ
jgi:hypothetical protein